MARERVTKEEVRAAIREGVGSAEKVEAVVLETDGTFSVVWQNVEGDRALLQDIWSCRRDRERNRLSSRTGDLLRF